MKDSSATMGLHHVELLERPLIVCDVDEVTLEFVTPFSAFLEANGHTLLPRSFRLTGNVVSASDGLETPAEKVRELLQSFFADQGQWQTPAEAASTSLAKLSKHADILFLTSMSPRHYAARRDVLDRHDLPYPLIATEEAKGPLIRSLHAGRPHPLFFIDDLLPNLLSVKKHAREARIVHYMANEAFRAMAPHPGDDVIRAESWAEIESAVFSHIGS